MNTRSDESRELFRVLSGRGFDPGFCELISRELNTTWTANRMIGYLSLLSDVSEEDIVDEMLGILSDRDQIMNKKQCEYNQARLNELYYKGL